MLFMCKFKNRFGCKLCFKTISINFSACYAISMNAPWKQTTGAYSYITRTLWGRFTLYCPYYMAHGTPNLVDMTPESESFQLTLSHLLTHQRVLMISMPLQINCFVGRLLSQKVLFVWFIYTYNSMGDDTKEYHALVLQLVNPEQVMRYPEPLLVDCCFNFQHPYHSEGDCFVRVEQKEGIISRFGTCTVAFIWNNSSSPARNYQYISHAFPSNAHPSR